MVKICLTRVGKKKHPIYRVIVLDKQKDPWGNYLENLGTYNPHTKECDFKEDRIKEWIAKGAQPSATIYNLLIEKGIIQGEKRRVSTLSKKRKGRLAKKEAVAKEKVAMPEAPAEEASEEETTAEVPAPVEEKKDEPVAEDVPAEAPVQEAPDEETK